MYPSNKHERGRSESSHRSGMAEVSRWNIGAAFIRRPRAIETGNCGVGKRDVLEKGMRYVRRVALEDESDWFPNRVVLSLYINWKVGVGGKQSPFCRRKKNANLGSHAWHLFIGTFWKTSCLIVLKAERRFFCRRWHTFTSVQLVWCRRQ